MDRLEVHERIIESELFWHGGALDVPKIYDAETRHHSGRSLKGTSSLGQDDIDEDDDAVELEVTGVHDAEWLQGLIVHE